MAFSPDGRRVFAEEGFSTAVLDVETGKQVWRSQKSDHFSLVDSVVFLADGHRILTGSNDDESRLLNADTGEVIQHFVGHTDRVTSAVLSLDGRRVLTASFEGTARLWDTETGKELATLVSFTDSGWAVVDPAGHYDGSDPDNSDSMYWVTDNLGTIDLGQLKKDYWTPALLGRVMRGERLPDVTDMDLVALPPLLSTEGDFNPAKREIKLKITDDGGGVGRLLVKVNDRLVQTIDHPLSPFGNKSLMLPIDLGNAPFVAGENAAKECTFPPYKTPFKATSKCKDHALVVPGWHFGEAQIRRTASPARHWGASRSARPELVRASSEASGVAARRRS